MRAASSLLATPVDSGLSLDRPFNGGVFPQPYPHPLATDMHQAFEVVVVISGQEDRHCEDLVLGLNPGDVWLSPAWEPHGWRATAPDTRELLLQFIPEFLGEETFDGMSWLSLFATSPRDRPRVTAAAMREQVLGLADELAQEIAEGRRRWATAVRLLTLRLLFLISRDWEATGLRGRPRYLRTSNLARIAPAVELVHRHPERRLSLAEGASACSLSVSHFCFLFQQSMGLSFGKHALRARLAYAAHLLLSSDSSMEAIAQRFGFVDVSHFHHAFSKQYGLTPAHYREEGQRRRS
jgi:AraC-like DNA-binding protein